MAASDWAELLATGVGSATAASVITGFVNRKKTDAETEKTAAETEAVEVDTAEQIVGMAMTLLEPMQKQIAELAIQTQALSARVVQLECENAELRAQVRFLEGV